MEINDDRREDAIEKANERWNNVHSHYEREQMLFQKEMMR